MLTSTTTTGVTYLWNGPTCPTCQAQYIGSHTCSREDLARRIGELSAQMARIGSPRAGATSCPCRKENSGSGVCGCILGGMTVTCSTKA